MDVVALHGLPAVLGHMTPGHLLPQDVAFELVLALGNVGDDGGVLFRSVRDSTFLGYMDIFFGYIGIYSTELRDPSWQIKD